MFIISLHALRKEMWKILRLTVHPTSKPGINLCHPKVGHTPSPCIQLHMIGENMIEDSCVCQELPLE